MTPTQTKARDYLTQVRTLLADPKNWIQGNMAQDANGCTTTVDKACRWCIRGAFLKAVKCYSWVLPPKFFEDECTPHSVAYSALFDAVIKHSGGELGCLTTWNDSAERTHQDVLDVCDQAIRYVEAA